MDLFLTKIIKYQIQKLTQRLREKKAISLTINSALLNSIYSRIIIIYLYIGNLIIAIFCYIFVYKLYVHKLECI